MYCKFIKNGYNENVTYDQHFKYSCKEAIKLTISQRSISRKPRGRIVGDCIKGIQPKRVRQQQNKQAVMEAGKESCIILEVHQKIWSFQAE